MDRAWRSWVDARFAGRGREGLFARARDAARRSWRIDRDLSVSYDRIGDVQVAQGDLAGALKSYRDSLAISDRLAQSDPGNASWQRDLGVLTKVGDVQVAQGDLAGALSPTRQPRDHRPPGAIRSRQRRLAARSLGVVREVGDVQVAQGDLAGALTSYRDSLAIRDRLAQSDPGNAGWRRDLSVSYNKVGDVQVAQGDLAGRARPPIATASRSETAWRNPIPATPAGSAISRCPTKGSATCRPRKATSPARSSPIATASRSPTAWRNPIPATRDGGAISRCRTTRGRRAGRAGRPRRRADLVPRQPRDCRSTGASRPQ